MKIRPLSEVEQENLDVGAISMTEVSNLVPLYNEKTDSFEKGGLSFPTEAEMEEYFAEEELDLE